jgi:hypothetical protein
MRAPRQQLTKWQRHPELLRFRCAAHAHALLLHKHSVQREGHTKCTMHAATRQVSSHGMM